MFMDADDLSLEIQGIKYDEARTWIVWLQIFTPSDLADSMAVNIEVARKFCRAAIFHGSVDLLEEELIDGPYGPEPVYQYIPLPEGPTEHYTKDPPEKVVGYTDILCPRGLPVRLVDNTKRRQSLSQPGVRLQIKNRDKRFEAMQLAVEQRKQRNKERTRILRDQGKLHETKSKVKKRRDRLED